MTKRNDKSRKSLMSLADALFEDLMNASDDEILSDFREAGGDPVAHGEKMRALFEKTTTQSKKSRLTSAKERMKQSQVSRSSRHVMSIDEAKKRLHTVLSNEAQALTLAARYENESEMSDDETFDMVDDLIELGLIGTSDQDESEF